MKSGMTFTLQLAAVVASAALLLLSGAWFCYTSTFDTATVGLMSVNILNGDRPLFFYGQPFFGALEAYLAAFFIFIFGFSEFVVSLSPIFFTLLWIVFTSLFFRRVFNNTAGIVAALCAAFPGYYVFWYSIATYGGYSALLCLGTAILWLSLVILQDNPEKIKLFLYCCCCGTLVALGIWVHALTYPYIAISAIILIWFLLKHRFRLTIIVSLTMALLIGLSGFLPYYFETGSFLGGTSETVPLTWPAFNRAVGNLFTVNIYELFMWNFHSSFQSEAVISLITKGAFFLLFAAVIFALCSFSSLQNKKYFVIPVAFCVLFVAMYVQHHLAVIKAPRYVIGFWIMLLCLCWSLAIAGQKNTMLRRLSSIFFSCYLVFQISGTLFFIAKNSDGVRHEQNLMQEVVNTAKEKGLQSVVTYGDTMFGYKAQKFGMFAQNSVIFAHADLERYQKNAQMTELDVQKGYITTAQWKKSLQNTLRDLGINFKIDHIGPYFLFSDLKTRQMQMMHALSWMEVSSDKDNRSITLQSSEYEGWKSGLALIHTDGKQVVVDTGAATMISGVWIFPAQNPFTFARQNPSAFSWQRPGTFEVSVSSDGQNFEKVYASLPESGNGFFAGEQFFLGGPWGKIEAHFSPVMARYVKIHFLDSNFLLPSDILIFSSDVKMRGSSANDIATIARIITDLDIHFVLADRRVSANLRDMFKNTTRSEIALPRHSTRFYDDPVRNFLTPHRGQAVVCDIAVADFCRKALVHEYGEFVLIRQIELEYYTFFALDDEVGGNIIQKESALLWNGHVLLQTNDRGMIAPWLFSVGMPIWRADYNTTKGIYHDSWTNGAGRFQNLNYKVRKEQGNTLVIHTNGWRPGPTDPESIQLEVVVNGGKRLHVSGYQHNSYFFLLPDSVESVNDIMIKSSTFIPAGRDSRNLGIDIKYIEVR